MSFPPLLNRCLSLSNGFIALPRTAKICDCCSQPLCSYSAALLEAILQRCNSAARFVRVFNPNLPGYNFEHVPTPLSAGGVGLYINELIPYRILEKESTSSFQALLCELNMRKGKNIICGVVYRQHNCPDHFLDYLSSKLETLCARNNEIILLGDFNIDLLKIESCSYSQKLFETLQSLSLRPTIDKPTRSYGSSATLIDNIFINSLDKFVLSGNIVSDISDHYSQVCFLSSNLEIIF